jgi:hypothetical protein
MKKCILTTFAAVLYSMILISCQNNKGEVSNSISSVTALKIEIKKCIADTSQSYFIALPQTPEPDKKYPILFAFDPHGNGKQAVDSLKEAAAKYGIIIVASNNIRNGYDKTEYALNALYNEVLSQYPVDRSKIYAIGFSGGGRVAQYLLAMHPEVAGVISCSAGFSLNNPSAFKNKTLFFITGNEDFNYNEVVQSCNSLIPFGVSTYVYEFNGKHEWPTSAMLCDAVLWLELDASKKNKNNDFEEYLEDFNNKVIRQIEQYKSDGRNYEAWQLCQRGIAFNNGINDDTRFTKTAEKLAKETVFKSQLAQVKQNNSLEQRLQQGYMQAMQQNDTNWWKTEVKVLNEKAATAGFQPDKAMYNRLLGFLSIMSYSYTNKSLTQNDLAGAAKYIAIYRIVDPTNADCIYYNSVYLFKSGKTEESKKEFKKAVGAGFTDFGKARAELPAEWFNN